MSRWPLSCALLTAAVLAACAAGEPEDGTAGSAPAATEAITIAADGLELQGNLYLPAGDRPAPGVVLIHGSGPHSRDGEIRGQLGLVLPEAIPVYRELAEGLQSQGFAVVTWDKRTCGPFNACAENGYPAPPADLSFEDLAADVSAATDFLSARADISEVALVGHSKGGTAAASVLAGREDVAALVLLASPAASLPDSMRFQADQIAVLVAETGPTTGTDPAVAELDALADDVEAIADGEVDGPDVGGASRDFWASWIDAAEAAPGQVRAAGVPTLALGGEFDWNVPPEHVHAWEPHLPPGGEIRILPNITHPLTYLATDELANIGLDAVGTEVDPAVVDALASWLDGTLG